MSRYGGQTRENVADDLINAAVCRIRPADAKGVDAVKRSTLQGRRLGRRTCVDRGRKAGCRGGLRHVCCTGRSPNRLRATSVARFFGDRLPIRPVRRKRCVAPCRRFDDIASRSSFRPIFGSSVTEKARNKLPRKGGIHTPSLSDPLARRFAKPLCKIPLTVCKAIPPGVHFACFLSAG